MLDEADRILDMGFHRTLTALLSHLPKSRQTLLFSATQTKSISELARLSLKDPVYVSAGEEEVTPTTLEQHYAVIELEKKLDTLWSFIKTHLQSKILVFFSCCKQVRFVYETFCKMHPGMSLMHLHGKQKQMARLATFDKFTKTKHAALFATDIAARGLDFPAVDWVVQVDCPEDAETYIHRVGRTARYESSGKAFLFLMPSEEEGMLEALKAKNIEVNKIKIKASKQQSIENQLQNLAFQDSEIKYLGQRVLRCFLVLAKKNLTWFYFQTFVAYLRSIHLQKNKAIFKVQDLPVDKYAASLGLPGAPKIKFLKKGGTGKNTSFATQEVDDDESGSGSSPEVESDEGDKVKSTVRHAADSTIMPCINSDYRPINRRPSTIRCLAGKTKRSCHLTTTNSSNRTKGRGSMPGLTTMKTSSLSSVPTMTSLKISQKAQTFQSAKFG